MRGEDWFGRYKAGAAQVSVSDLRRQETVGVRWPSPWTALAATAISHGLHVTPSEPGLAATALIRTLGSVEAVQFLRHRPLIELLRRMAERSGMSWWKRRWTSAVREMDGDSIDEDVVRKVEAFLESDTAALAPAGEGRAVPFKDFVRALGSDVGARRWVAWAERRHLLVRGSDVDCGGCRTHFWVPLAALPPPVPCPGCGRLLEHPYPAGELRFTYRLGEPLRRTFETDSFGHVLALHWFDAYIGRRGLVGAHPGTNLAPINDPTSVIGEVDLLLLLADGRLVPVEVKRTIAGVGNDAVRKLDDVSDALDAPWDALAVTMPARDAAPLSERQRRLPSRPRVVLTDDQLLSQRLFWGMGEDPFEWRPQIVEQDQEQELQFTRWLRENDPDEARDMVADYLLRPPGQPEG